MELPRAVLLTRRAREELVGALAQAFAHHPVIPALGGRAGDASALMRALVDFHWSMKSLLVCGIRMDEGLVCGLLGADSREVPSLWPLARLAWGVTRAVGRRAIGPLLDVERYKPLHQESYFELVLLATVPSRQRQGLGRRLLHFLCDQAKREGYDGIMLFVDQDTPAFGLYRSEGFEVDREFGMALQRLCWMRRTI
jgi:ribosomal protein S18 acetylase RimI-like enzyme